MHPVWIWTFSGRPFEKTQKDMCIVCVWCLRRRQPEQKQPVWIWAFYGRLFEIPKSSVGAEFNWRHLATENLWPLVNRPTVKWHSWPAICVTMDTLDGAHALGVNSSTWYKIDDVFLVTDVRLFLFHFCIVKFPILLFQVICNIVVVSSSSYKIRKDSWFNDTFLDAS